MKTILVPIDFSEVSDNALNYAVKFAKKAMLQIRLLNIYDYPIVPSDVMAWIPPIEELVEENLKRLESIRDNIHKQYGEELNVEYYCEMGTVIETINTFAEKHHIDMIIMGMQGGGFVSEKIIGSTTASLMRKAVCPVLGIAKRLKYHSIDKIVLATDYEDADYTRILQPLKELILIFNSNLYVLYMEDPAINAGNEIPTGGQVAHALKGIPYKAEMTTSADLAIAIDRFVEDNTIDMVVIVPRKHSFFYSLFHESHTKKLTFHTEMPLLALHE